MYEQQKIFLDIDQTLNSIKKEKAMRKVSTPATSEVTFIHRRIVEECISKMRVAKCSFKIVLADGTVHEHDPDNRLNPTPERKRGKSKYPHGALVNHYRPYLEVLGVGDVAAVPLDMFDGVTLLSSMSAWASHNWGLKSHQVAQNLKDNTVELMRLK